MVHWTGTRVSSRGSRLDTGDPGLACGPRAAVRIRGRHVRGSVITERHQIPVRDCRTRTQKGRLLSQQMQDTVPMPVEGWASVYDAGPSFNRHWFRNSCEDPGVSVMWRPGLPSGVAWLQRAADHTPRPVCRPASIIWLTNPVGLYGRADRHWTGETSNKLTERVRIATEQLYLPSRMYIQGGSI